LVDSEGNYLPNQINGGSIDSRREKRVRIGITMMAETEEQIKSGNSAKKAGPVWNLKGRSIEDILTDLKIFKNDSDILMPVIEADPASIEDFQQYTRNIPAANNNIAEDEKFCNQHPECISTVTSRVFRHFMAMTNEERSKFFKPYRPPMCYIQRRLQILSLRPIVDNTSEQSYDRWYWSLFVACSIEMECEVPLRHVVDMVHKAIYDGCSTNSVFRRSAQIHNMYNAMQRNTQLPEAPEWVWARNCQC